MNFTWFTLSVINNHFCIFVTCKRNEWKLKMKSMVFLNCRDVHKAIVTFSDAVALNKPCQINEQCRHSPHALCLQGKCGCTEGYSDYDSAAGCLKGLSIHNLWIFKTVVHMVHSHQGGHKQKNAAIFLVISFLKIIND